MARQEHTGICHICGEYKKLTYEHIPPEAAFNSQRRKMSTVKELMARLLFFSRNAALGT